MQELRFPINFQFKISSLANDFIATDASGKTVAYVKQKLFKLKEVITIYGDEQKENINYTIQADKWLDFSAAYSFLDAEGQFLGKIARKGWVSMWKAQYDIIDQHEKLQYHIKEESPWIKVVDSMIGWIPVLRWFSGYLANPTYIVKDIKEKPIVRLSKLPSMLGHKFELTKVGVFDADDDDRIMLGLMMMLLLERKRG